jgi:polyhydroxyalkanoate synthesis repressor PhaR
MSVRVIKKYPNRRLYDTEDSRYITLSDIRDLVLGKIEFVVVDKKNGHDITRCVLLQVISEREQQGDPVMSRAFLSEIIRYRAELRSAPLSAHLEQSLSMYLTQRAGSGTAGASEAAQRNVTGWKSVPHENRRRFTDDADSVEQPQVPPKQKKAG